MRFLRFFPFLVVCILLFESCASIFGGPVTPEQKRAPSSGPYRKVRPDFLIFNLFTPYYLGYVFDFSSGAIYEPPAYMYDSLANRYFSNRQGDDIKLGINFAPLIANSLEITGEYSFRNKLSITLTAGVTENSRFSLSKVYDGGTSKTSGGYLKAGGRLYLFNSLQKKRIANMDLFLGVSAIASRYKRTHYHGYLYNNSLADPAYEPQHVTRGQFLGLGISPGLIFRIGKRIEWDLGIQIPVYIQGKENISLNSYQPGFGSGDFVQGIFGIKYRFAAD